MKKELKYFYIGKNLGWNQNDFTKYWMKIGGCGAVTACDSFVYFKKYFNKDKLYPYSVENVDYDEYYSFTNVIKPYLRPRVTGIDSLDIYIDGIKKYFNDVGENTLEISGFEGCNEYEDAKSIVKMQIDNDYIVPMLMLKNANTVVRDYVWHWFLLGGYDEIDSKFMVKVITYGDYRWIDFEDLWNSGHRRKGGLIIYK
jgi:hypothetical protein